MTKMMVIPKNFEMIKKLVDKSDAFLIGIENFSVNLPTFFSLEEAKEIISFLNNHEKEVFISLNKNIKNSELENLEEIMFKLNDFKIQGVLYYDMAVVNLWKKHRFKYDLVWAQEHFATNYNTCNYWKKMGINYGLLSTEITLDEIIEIIKNSKMKFILPLFGYLPMFASFRHLVNNYLDYFEKEKISNSYYMEKEGKKYMVIDDNHGTFVYSSNIINGLLESVKLKEVGLSYILLNSFNIDDEKFEEVVTMFNEVTIENSEELDKKIYEMFNNVDKGFLYTKTVYKVKENE